MKIPFFLAKYPLIGRTVVAHSFNPRPWEAERVPTLNSRPVRYTEGIPGQPGIYRETMFRKQQQQHNNSQQGDSTDKSVYHASLTTGI